MTIQKGYRSWALAVAMALAAPSAAVSQVYVDRDATGANDGSSWQNAYTDLQSALALPAHEIWVAKGTYTPASAGGSRSASFEILDAQRVYGGFSGTETDLNQRDPQLHLTVLSGDLNGDDTGRFGNRSDNSYHVVRGGNTQVGTVLDGFTISGGNASPQTEDGNGGGMYNDRNALLTIAQCRFTDNQAWNGGALANFFGCDPQVVDCSFDANEVISDGGGIYLSGSLDLGASNGTFTRCCFRDNRADDGGAVRSKDETFPVFVDCEFLDNTANEGGGVYGHADSPAAPPFLLFEGCVFRGNNAESTRGGGGVKCSWDCGCTFRHCTFRSNTTDGNGGACMTYQSNPQRFENCLFVANTAQLSGGAICNSRSTEVKLYCCTIKSNQAFNGDGGGVYHGDSGSEALHVGTSVLWDNTANNGSIEDQQIAIRAGRPFAVSYCCIQGCSVFCGAGPGNTSSDPRFADDSGRIGPGSSCLDAGNNDHVGTILFDLDGSERRVDDDCTEPDPGNGSKPVVDMGCFEFTGCLLPPEVHSVTPFDGPSFTEQPVDVHGVRFRGTIAVLFDGNPGTGVQVHSETYLTVVAPPLAAGSVDVMVCSDTLGCSEPLVDGYRYEIPLIESIDPPSGFQGEELTLTITGSYFVHPLRVYVGNEEATNVQFDGDRTVRADVEGQAGCVDVVVVNEGRDSSEPYSGFCFERKPVFFGAVPAVGGSCGEELVRLLGAHFQPGCEVLWDGRRIPCNYVDEHNLTVVTPAHAEGPVDVVVRIENQSTGKRGAFTYEVRPTQILDVYLTDDAAAPVEGSYLGATSVTIVGEGFSPDTQVWFGRDPSPDVEVVDRRTIKALTPLHIEESCWIHYLSEDDRVDSIEVDVRVVSVGGSDTARDAFRYTVGAILEVPQHYPSIQAAIDAAQDGDAVLVDPDQQRIGVDYTESLDLRDRRIYLGGREGLGDRPVIQSGSSALPVILVNQGQDAGLILSCLELRSAERGVEIRNSSPVVVFTEIHDMQTTEDGGGILVVADGTDSQARPRILYNDIHTNEHARNGGGIAVMGEGSSPRLVGNILTGNVATGDGGGLYIEDGASLRLVEGGEFLANTAGGLGGGIYVGSRPASGPLANQARRIKNVDLLDNVAHGSGGGVFASGGNQLRVTGCDFCGNLSATGSGGGLAVDHTQRAGTGGTQVLLEGSRFEWNRCDGYCGMGGGIYLAGLPGQEVAPAELHHNLICNNHAQVGGGLAMHVKVAALIQRNTFANNNLSLAELRDGDGSDGEPRLCPWQADTEEPDVFAPGVFENDCEVLFCNNTVYANGLSSSDIIPDSGGGFHARKGMFGGSEIMNNIFSMNGRYELWLQSTSSGLAPDYNLFFNHDAGDCGGNRCGNLGINNLTGLDPELVDPDTCDWPGFELWNEPGVRVSPCLDAGDPDCGPPPIFGTIDIGAREWFPVGKGDSR